MGPNLLLEPDAAPPPPPDGPLRLLFVGYDWRRKGGDIVLAAFEKLRATHASAELHIVGCSPPAAEAAPGVILHGKLFKGIPDQARRLDDLYRTAAFLFMPSRQEAFGVVFSEACAHGLPPVAADTGGVGTIIEPGFNGILLPLSASAEDFAGAIEAVWADRAAYLAMRAAARRVYESRVNWRAWGEAVDAALARATAAAAHRS